MAGDFNLMMSDRVYANLAEVRENPRRAGEVLLDFSFVDDQGSDVRARVVADRQLAVSLAQQAGMAGGLFEAYKIYAAGLRDLAEWMAVGSKDSEPPIGPQALRQLAAGLELLLPKEEN